MIRRPVGRAVLLPACCLLLAALGCTDPSSSEPDGWGGSGGEGGAFGEGGDGGIAAGSAGAAAALPSCTGAVSFFATEVIDYAFGPGQSFGQELFPGPVLGPPRGTGSGVGSTDVVSLGDGGFVVLGFAGNAIVDGAGPDFLVFENAFLISGDETNPYAELGEVSVSQDGETWFTFPCSRREYPYGSCAGWRPVFETEDESAARDPARVGGDPFDLADLELDWARFVRIVDVHDEGQAAFDLDAVALVHAACD